MFSDITNNEKLKPNRFGEGIEFREGAPIQLLRYNDKYENGKFGHIVLNSKALDIVCDVNEPLAIISVGKSLFFFLKNNLYFVT